MEQSLRLSTSREQFLLHGPYQQIDVSRFHNVIVHLIVKGLNGCLESRVSRQKNGYAFGINLPHGIDYVESVAILTDVDVGQEDIKFVILSISSTASGTLAATRTSNPGGLIAVPE